MKFRKFSLISAFVLFVLNIILFFWHLLGLISSPQILKVLVSNTHLSTSLPLAISQFVVVVFLGTLWIIHYSTWVSKRFVKKSLGERFYLGVKSKNRKLNAFKKRVWIGPFNAGEYDEASSKIATKMESRGLTAKELRFQKVSFLHMKLDGTESLERLLMHI